MTWSKDNLTLDEDWGRIQEAVTWLGSQFFMVGKKQKISRLILVFSLEV